MTRKGNKGKTKWGVISPKIYEYKYEPKKLSKIEIEKEYADLHIRKYNFDEFSKYYKGPKEDLLANWARQQYKQKVIEEGGYRQYREFLFKENYIGTLKELLGSDDPYYEALTKLTKRQWNKLWTYKVPSKKEAIKYNEGYILPSLSALGVYKINGVYDGDEEAIEEFRQDLRQALKEVLGIDPEKPDVFISEPVQVNIRHMFTGISPATISDEGKKYKNIFRFARKSFDIELDEEDAQNLESDPRRAAFYVLRDREERGKLYAVSKYGKRYIRGVSKAVQLDYEAWRKR